MQQKFLIHLSIYYSNNIVLIRLKSRIYKQLLKNTFRNILGHLIYIMYLDVYNVKRYKINMSKINQQFL
jgi:hypothetical protein